MGWLRALFSPRVWTLFVRVLFSLQEAGVTPREIQVRRGKDRIWVALGDEEEEGETIGFGSGAYAEEDAEAEE